MLTTASYLSILRAYWRASGELAEVESQNKGDFEMQAHKDFITLEKTLKTYLTAWNDDVPEGESKITECSKVGQESKCELYFAEDGSGDDEYRCKPCAAIHRDRRTWEEGWAR